MRKLLLLFVLWIAGTASAATFNVMSYGATGNGVTDDTAAIRLAATALRDAGGGILYFPLGTYKVLGVGTNTVTLDPDDNDGNNLAYFRAKAAQPPLRNISVISDGATLLIGRLFTTSETGLLFGFKDCTNVNVDGFIVTGPTLNVPSGIPHGVNFVLLYQGNVNVTMPNNKVQGVLAGMNCVVESAGQPKSKNIVISNLYAYDSVYGLTTGNGCDDVVAHALTTKDIGRSYVAYGVKNHTINLTSLGSFTEDAVLGAPVDNMRLSYTSPVDYAFANGGMSGSGHARIRMSFGAESSTIRNVDIRLHITYDGTTQGGPAFRLLKYANVPQTLENLKISGYVKGKPNTWPTGDPDGPIIGTVDTPNYWSTNDAFRNIELSNLRIENSKPTRFILPGLKGGFLLSNVHSDNSVQLVQALTGGHPYIDPPADGRFAIVNSTFPNLASYYATESAEPLDPINGSASLTVPVGWQGHMISSEWTGSAVTYTLPSATRGLEFSFIRANGAVFVRPQSGQSIRGGTTGWALSLDTLGDGATLRCVVPGVWEILSSNGTIPFVP